MNGSQPSDGGIDRRHLRDHPGELAHRSSRTTVFGTDQQTPIAGVAKVGQHIVADLSGRFVDQGSAITVTTDHFQAPLRDRGKRRGINGRLAAKQLGGDTAIPDRTMRGTIDGLVRIRKQILHLIVGGIHLARSLCFVRTGAAQPQRDFGERLAVGLVGDRIGRRFCR